MSSRVLMTVLVAATALTASCRSERKGVRVGAEAATLKVEMFGLSTADQDKTNWVYELSGCLGAINGDLGEANWVTFKGLGLKQGLTGCQLKLRTLTPNAGDLWTFVGAEPVFYFGREVDPLSFDETGALKSQVQLVKTYEPKQAPGTKQYFTLKVPVVFPAAEARKPITAHLTCVPPLDTLGIYPTDNPATGAFTFGVELASEKAYNCASLTVDADGTANQYQGVLSGTSGQFTAGPDQALTLKPVTLTKVVKDSSDNNGGSIDVDVKPEDCTQAGKQYNTVTRQCEDKPPG